jgi:hypothetical protein
MKNIILLPNFEIKFENDLSKSSSGILNLIQGNEFFYWFISFHRSARSLDNDHIQLATSIIKISIFTYKILFQIFYFQLKIHFKF